jgi:hypothetical protein
MFAGSHTELSTPGHAHTTTQRNTRLKLETWVISLVTSQMKYRNGIKYGIHPKQDKLAQFRSPNIQ